MCQTSQFKTRRNHKNKLIYEYLEEILKSDTNYNIINYKPMDTIRVIILSKLNIMINSNN